MIPILVSVAGFLIIILCVYGFKKAAGALYRRRMYEAIEADSKTFASKDEDE